MATPILHIILAFLLLVSSTGFTLSTHHCGGKLVDVALIGEAADCYGNVDRANCLDTKQKPRCKKGCCHDSADYYDADLEPLQTIVAFPQTDISELVAIPVFTVLSVFHTTIPRIVATFSPDRPPIVRTDIAVWFQVFRL